MMKKIMYHLPSIIFNIAETLVIFLIGILLGLDVHDILLTFFVFGIIRIMLKNNSCKIMHYKNWELCLCWSALQLFSLFLTMKVGVLIGITATIFSALILSEKGNIRNVFMWGGNTLNNEVFNWVKFNKDNEKLMKYEEKLKETDKQKYYIFRYRFREFKSYNQISSLMGIDAQRISEEVKTMSHFIEYSIRLDG